MPKFIVIESQMVARRVQFKYEVEAESPAAACQIVRDGPEALDAANPIWTPTRDDVGDDEYGTSGLAAIEADATQEEIETTEAIAHSRMDQAAVAGLDSLAADDEADDEGAIKDEFRR